MIFHLLKKDLRRTWAMILAFVGFALVLCAVVLRRDYVEGSGYGSSSGLVMAGLMLYMLVFGNLMSIEKYEEKYHGYRILAQLPVSRLDLVLSKYLLVLTSTVIGVFVLNSVYGLFSVLAAFPGERLKFLVLSGSICLVLNGFSYLGVFAYGYRRVRSAIMALYIISLAGPQLYIILQATRGVGSSLLESLSAIPPFVIPAVAVVAIGAFVGAALGAAKTHEYTSV